MTSLRRSSILIVALVAIIIALALAVPNLFFSIEEEQNTSPNSAKEAQSSAQLSRLDQVHDKETLLAYFDANLQQTEEAIARAESALAAGIEKTHSLRIRQANSEKARVTAEESAKKSRLEGNNDLAEKQASVAEFMREERDRFDTVIEKNLLYLTELSAKQAQTKIEFESYKADYQQLILKINTLTEEQERDIVNTLKLEIKQLNEKKECLKGTLQK